MAARRGLGVDDVAPPIDGLDGDQVLGHGEVEEAVPAAPLQHGYGSKLKSAGFSLWFHIPRCHFGTTSLSRQMAFKQAGILHTNGVPPQISAETKKAQDASGPCILCLGVPFLEGTCFGLAFKGIKRNTYPFGGSNPKRYTPCWSHTHAGASKPAPFGFPAKNESAKTKKGARRKVLSAAQKAQIPYEQRR